MNAPSSKFSISTKRLELRRWKPDDADDAYAFWGDPDVMCYAGGPDEDVEVSRKSLILGDEVFVRDGVCLWPVVLKETGSVIGCCGFHQDKSPGHLELAYHLRKSHWGQGYGSEAVTACIQYAQDVLGAQSIVAFVWPRNVASCKLLESVGFSQEGQDRGELVYRLNCHHG